MKWRRLRTRGSLRSGEERIGHSSTLCGHLVFVHGGGCSGTLTPTICDFVFNTKRRHWKRLEIALELKKHSATLVDDKLFVIGGLDKHIMFYGGTMMMRAYTINLPLLELEELQTHCILGSDGPPQTSSHLAGFFEAKREIVIVGRSKEDYGRENPHDHPPHQYALSVDSMTWRKLDAQGRAPAEYFPNATCMFEREQTMYVYSSLREDDAVGELYIMDYKGRNPVWSLVATHGKVPTELSGSCLDMLPNRSLLLFGGYFAGGESDNAYKYDVSTAVWTKAAKERARLGQYDFEVKGKFRPRMDHTSVCIGGQIWYFGGGKDNKVFLSDVLVLDLQ